MASFEQKESVDAPIYSNMENARIQVLEAAANKAMPIYFLHPNGGHEEQQLVTVNRDKQEVITSCVVFPETKERKAILAYRVWSFSTLGITDDSPHEECMYLLRKPGTATLLSI